MLVAKRHPERPYCCWWKETCTSALLVVEKQPERPCCWCRWRDITSHGLRVLPVPATLGWRCHGDGGAAGAGPEAGGGDVVLPVAHLEPDVAEAALQDCVGTVAEGRKGRHVATAADPDALRSPQLLGQVTRSSDSSLSAAVLCLGIG